LNNFQITDAAATRISELLVDEAVGARLRIAIDGGGCSGFQYNFTFDNKVEEDDSIFEKNGVSVVIDNTSLDLLNGSQLDFIENLGESTFRITNPNATAKCGCGNSFAV